MLPLHLPACLPFLSFSLARSNPNPTLTLTLTLIQATGRPLLESAELQLLCYPLS